MRLSLQEVEHIAELARLELSAEEKALFQEQLSAILEYAAQLQALDTRGVPPAPGVLPVGSVLRADQPRPGLSPQELLANAPQTGQGQFRVPPVME